MPSDQDQPSAIPDLQTSLAAAFNEPGAIDPASNTPNSDPVPKLEPVEAPDESNEPNPSPDAKDPSKASQTPPAAQKPVSQGLPKGAVPENAKADEIPDPETFVMPKNIAKKDEAGWTKLKSTSKQLYDRLNHETEEVKKLKTALAERPSVNTKEFEALQKEVEELRGVRSILDVESDPEYIKDYLEPLKQSEAELVSILKQNGVADEVIAGIDFKSSKVVSQVYKTIQDTVDLLVADQFKENAQNYLKALVKNDKFLKEHKVKHKEFTAKRQQEQQIKGTQSQAAAEAEIERIASLKVEGKEDAAFPFLQTFKARDGAPDDEIEAVKQHNDQARANRAKVNSVLQAIKTGSPQEQAQTAIAAVTAGYLQGLTNQLAQENANLKAELAKVGKAENVRSSPGDTPRAASKGLAADFVDAETALSRAFPGMK